MVQSSRFLFGVLEGSVVLAFRCLTIDRTARGTDSEVWMIWSAKQEKEKRRKRKMRRKNYEFVFFPFSKVKSKPWSQTLGSKIPFLLSQTGTFQKQFLQERSQCPVKWNWGNGGAEKWLKLEMEPRYSIQSEECPHHRSPMVWDLKFSRHGSNWEKVRWMPIAGEDAGIDWFGC